MLPTAKVMISYIFGDESVKKLNSMSLLVKNYGPTTIDGHFPASD